MTTTYLVTGGAGFIGSNFVLGLLGKQQQGNAKTKAKAPRGASQATHEHDICDDIRVINVDKLTYAGNLANLAALEGDERHIFVQADICDATTIGQLFSRYQPQYVVNFAAESHVDRSIEDPGIFVQTNVGGTVTLLQAAKQAWEQDAASSSTALSGTTATVEGSASVAPATAPGSPTVVSGAVPTAASGVAPAGLTPATTVCAPTASYLPGVRFLQVSTDEVYGSLGATGFFTEDTPLDPHSPYSASKAAADLLVQAFYDTYQLPVNITRCSNNYGPLQFPEKLIPLMLNNALKHQALPVYGDGLQVRDWLYVEDHCKAIELVLHQGVPGEVYNIGGHNERTNIQIVQAILDYLAKHVDKTIGEDLIAHVTDRKGHDRRYGIDPRKIGDALGWQPETAFEQGIVRTLSWHLAHQDWVANVTSGAYRSYYQKMYGNR